ncbi:MAG: HipA domain-containing protein [Polaromonas sp.]|nr:HipA domain-containing protein [Polaromonas sp.]
MHDLLILDHNVSETQLRYQTRPDGAYVKLARGIGVNKNLSPVDRMELVTSHSVRILKALVPEAVLAGAAALHRSPVDGIMMVHTPYGGDPIEVGGVFTIHRSKCKLDIGLNGEVEQTTILDSFGETTCKRLADEILVIKNFDAKVGYPPGAALNAQDLLTVIQRSAEKHGGHRGLQRRLEALMRLHGWDAPGKIRRAALLQQIELSSSYRAEPKPIKAFKVYWHKAPVATLTNDGYIWSMTYDPGVNLKLSIAEKEGKKATPRFLMSLMPEREIRDSDDSTAMLERLHDFNRYVSNICIQTAEPGKQRPIIDDVLQGSLRSYCATDGGAFTGHVAPSLRALIAGGDDHHDDDDDYMPRMSGMQVKFAAHLSLDGELSPAKGKSFTHIVKVANFHRPSFASMGTMEWFTMSMAKKVGIQVENFGIIDAGECGPAFVAERFDIKTSLNDTRLLLTEDFGSVTGMMRSEDKYKGDWLEVADELTLAVTNPREQAKRAIQQLAFSWLVMNNDLHLKNLSLLKVASKGVEKGFDQVELTPAYDLMCTAVYPGQERSSALAIGGEKRLTLASFYRLGRRMNLSDADVKGILVDLVENIPRVAEEVIQSAPRFVLDHAISVDHMMRARDLLRQHCAVMREEIFGPRPQDQELVDSFRQFMRGGKSTSHRHSEAIRCGLMEPPGAGSGPSPFDPTVGLSALRPSRTSISDASHDDGNFSGSFSLSMSESVEKERSLTLGAPSVGFAVEPLKPQSSAQDLIRNSRLAAAKTRILR